MPPIFGVEQPTAADINCWRKRWKKNKYKAPKFWEEFFKIKFKLALSLPEIYKWGEWISTIKFALPESTVQALRNAYTEEKFLINNF